MDSPAPPDSILGGEAERIRLGLPRAPWHALQQLAHQQTATNAANGQSPATATRPQTGAPAGNTHPTSAGPPGVPDIDPALIIGTQEVFLYGPVPPPPHITVAPGHLLWSLDGLNWVAATCPDHFFQQVATYGDVQVRARPLGAGPDTRDTSAATQARPPPWALACLLVWALLVSQPRPSMAAAVVTLDPPSRKQAARWMHRRVAYRMWQAMQFASAAFPQPVVPLDRISRLEQHLERAQSTLEQVRSSATQHSETLRNLASGIQQQVAAATAAPTIPPGLTAALSTAQALLNRFHST